MNHDHEIAVPPELARTGLMFQSVALPDKLATAMRLIAAGAMDQQGTALDAAPSPARRAFADGSPWARAAGAAALDRSAFAQSRHQDQMDARPQPLARHDVLPHASAAGAVRPAA